MIYGKQIIFWEVEEGLFLVVEGGAYFGVAEVILEPPRLFWQVGIEEEGFLFWFQDAKLEVVLSWLEEEAEHGFHSLVCLVQGPLCSPG